MKAEGRSEYSHPPDCMEMSKFQRQENKCIDWSKKQSNGYTLADHTATKTSLLVNPEALLSLGVSGLDQQAL